MRVATHQPAQAALLLLTGVGLVGALAGLPGAVVYDNLHWTCGYALAAWLAWRGRERADDAPQRRARGWFAAGLGLLALGQLIWVAQVGLHWLPFPGPSDAFFLSLGPALAVGLWQLARHRLTPDQRQTAGLDAAAFVVAVVAASMALFLPRQGSYSLFQILVMAAYPLGLVAPASLGMILALTTRSPLGWRAWLLPLAAAVFAVQWVAWNLRFLDDRLIDGGWLNASFTVVALAIGAGAGGYRLKARDDPAWDRLCEGVLRLLPMVLVLLAAAGIVLTNTLHGMPPASDTSAAVGGAVVVVLAMLRHGLLLRERDRLIEVERLLRQREAELEARVDQRTRELALASEQAQAASRAKSDFLANMSHEIRTPLNSVIGLAHIAHGEAADPRQRDLLDKIRRSGRQLLRLIEDVLDMSKIEAGHLELEHTRVELARVFDDVRDQLGGRARAKGLDLRFEIDAGARQPLLGDSLRLGQVVLNLVGNAVKFTERGSVAVAARCVGGGAGRCQLEFSVADTGPGIAPAVRERLFQPFQQGDPSTSRRFGGTGLGLAISRQLVERMGGRIEVESEPGSGTRFWFTLTLELADDAGPALAPAGGELAPDALHGLHVLVAEDNEMNQIVAVHVLESAGVSVRLAGDGEQALDWLARERFDGVLMDMQMPGIDGLEATRRLRTRPELDALPVIAMTANARPEDDARCREAGMDDFLTKPVDPDRLYAVLGRWIGPAATMRRRDHLAQDKPPP